MHRSPSPPQETDLVRSLLAAAGSEAVPQGSRERVAQRLGMPTRARVPSGARQPAVAPLAAKQTKVGAWSKVALLGVVGGLWVGGSALLPSPRSTAAAPQPSALPALASTPAPSMDAAARSVPSVPSESALSSQPSSSKPSPSDAPAPPLPARGVATIPGQKRAMRARNEASASAVRPTKTAAHGLLAEVQALDRVRHALHGGEAALALIGLDDYSGEFPHGELALEAAVLRAQALLGSGRGVEARALARRTLTAPGSDRYRKELEHMFAEER